MSQLDRNYLLERERHARSMAERARDEQTRRIHTELADAYAALAREGRLESAA